MWQMFEPDEQERVIKNITMSLKEGIQAGVNSEPVPEHIQQLNLYNMSRVDDDLGQRLATALGLDLQKAIDVGKKTQDALYSRQMAGTVRDPSRES